MDKKYIERQVKQYAEAVKKHLKVKKIVLFGSYARGNAHKESDIDIAVIMRTGNYDYFEVNAILQKLKRDIDFRIEPIALTEKPDPSGFVRDILQYGKIIS